MNIDPFTLQPYNASPKLGPKPETKLESKSKLEPKLEPKPEPEPEPKFEFHTLPKAIIFNSSLDLSDSQFDFSHYEEYFYDGYDG